MQRQIGIFAAAALLVFSFLGASATGAGEQKVTVTMVDEGGRMVFRPDRVTLQAGVKAEIVLVNKGKVKHEFAVYAMPKAGTSREQLKDWAEGNSYFKDLEVKVEGGGVEVEGTNIFEIEVAAGKSAEVKFTPKKTGTFEIGCLIKDQKDHYASGMKGTLVVK